MSRSKYRAPFHRRIIPWVFACVFFVVAPALIFYTSGYRFNPNKIVLEKNGTLIVDSTPDNAFIELNGQLQKETTESTIQFLSPGSYLVRVTKDGYHPWEKRLQVSSEQVTFANAIYLWKKSEPTLITETKATTIVRAPERDRYLTIDASTSSKTIRIYDRDSLIKESLLSSSTSIDYVQFLNDDEYSLSFVHEPYQRITSLRTQETLSLPRSSSTVDQNLLTVEPSTTTQRSLVTWKSTPKKHYELPSGDWVLERLVGTVALFKDNQRYLTLKENESISRELTGTLMSWKERKNDTAAIFLSQQELWLWNLSSSPELLLRLSEPFISADWHRDSDNVFYATKKALYALELDQRSGRQQTRLAEFDQIYSLVAFADRVVVLAIKDGKQGLYSIVIE